jgi:hypothetical protein
LRQRERGEGSSEGGAALGPGVDEVGGEGRFDQTERSGTEENLVGLVRLGFQ